MGWGDPLAYLALPEDDFVVATAVVNRALQLRNNANKKK